MQDVAKEIATQILQQLGGNMFVAMTGSSRFMIMDCEKPYGLRMNLKPNKSGANFLYIYLNDSDTYTMIFKYFHLNMKTLKEKRKEIAVFEDVYAEDLQRFFTDVTGVCTKLT